MLKRIHCDGEEIAIIISDEFRCSGVKFVTDDSYSQQLAYMNRPKDEYIKPHYHNENSRSVSLTQEVLVIKKGRLRVDFYSSSQKYFGSEELTAGDVLMLATGGHAFKMLEPVEMLEVKQGPYGGDRDKTLFTGVSEAEIRKVSTANFSVEEETE